MNKVLSAVVGLVVLGSGLRSASSDVPAGGSTPSAGAAVTPAASGGAVAEWSLIAQNTIVSVARKFPGEAAVYMGMVHAAIYGAAAVVPRHAALDAAVAAAAHRVLVERFPDQQPALDAAYDQSLARLPDGRAKARGIEVGERVGDDMVRRRLGDGLDDAVPYVQPAPGPGVYEPTGAPQPLGAQLPAVRPLVLSSADQFRPDGPNALASDAYARDFQEVKQIGRVDGPRTEEQTRVALFWTDHDLPQWNRNLLRLASARGLTPRATARMLAMAHVAGGDAMLACFDAKYHYLSWRPLHAIQRADADGNPATSPDSTWQPLRPTPNHPEYPSAHACHSSAVREALVAFFGTDKVPFSLDSLVTGETRYYERFGDAVKEVNDARVWAGFHFRHSDEDGALLGRRVGRYVVQRFQRACF